MPKATVLVVDDNAIIRKMLRYLFETEGLEVCDAADGAEGVEKAQQLNPSLVILDLSMPVMNGFDAARSLKLTMPHIPLMMFTNHDGLMMEKEAQSVGIRAVISKSDPEFSGRLVREAKALVSG